MKRILALWLAAMLIAVQPCYAVVMVGFGQSASAGISDDFSTDCSGASCTNYTAFINGFLVSSGAAYGTDGYGYNGWIHNTSTGSAAHYVQATVEMVSAAGSGLVFGASAASSSATGYFAYIHNLDAIKLYTFSGSTLTDTEQFWYLGTALTANTQYVFRIEKNGNTITLKIDGVTIGSLTNSTYTTGQYIGIYANRATGGNPKTDNLTAGAL